LGGSISGASGSALKVTGAADLASPILGGYFAISAGATVEDAKAITQDGDIGGSGLLEIDAGATYTISSSARIEVANFDNAGTVTVSSGLLDVETAIAGTGTDTIMGAAQLEFHGKIAGFDTTGAGDALTLTGAWSVGLFSENGAGTGGTLALTSGGNPLTLQFTGHYLSGHFAAKAGAGTTVLTYS
jgi:hypothetical protein